MNDGVDELEGITDEEIEWVDVGETVGCCALGSMASSKSFTRKILERRELNTVHLIVELVLKGAVHVPDAIEMERAEE